MNDPLTIPPLTAPDLFRLVDIVHAIQTSAKVRWLTESGTVVENVARAFTDTEGNFLDSHSDVRNAYLWTSGIFEHFIPVSTVLTKMASGDLYFEGQQS